MNSGKLYNTGLTNYTYAEVIEIGRIAGIDLHSALVDDVDPVNSKWRAFTLVNTQDRQQAVKQVIAEHGIWFDSPFALENYVNLATYARWGYILWVADNMPEQGFNQTSWKAYAADLSNYEQNCGVIHVGHDILNYRGWIKYMGLKNRLRNYQLYQRWIDGRCIYEQRQQFTHEVVEAMERYSPVQMGQTSIVPASTVQENLNGDAQSGVRYSFICYVIKSGGRFLVVEERDVRERVQRENVYAIIHWNNCGPHNFGHGQLLREIPAGYPL